MSKPRFQVVVCDQNSGKAALRRCLAHPLLIPSCSPDSRFNCKASQRIAALAIRVSA